MSTNIAVQRSVITLGQQQPAQPALSLSSTCITLFLICTSRFTFSDSPVLLHLTHTSSSLLL